MTPTATRDFLLRILHLGLICLYRSSKSVELQSESVCLKPFKQYRTVKKITGNRFFEARKKCIEMPNELLKWTNENWSLCAKTSVQLDKSLKHNSQFEKKVLSNFLNILWPQETLGFYTFDWQEPFFWKFFCNSLSSRQSVFLLRRFCLPSGRPLYASVWHVTLQFAQKRGLRLTCKFFFQYHLYFWSSLAAMDNCSCNLSTSLLSWLQWHYRLVSRKEYLPITRNFSHLRNESEASLKNSVLNRGKNKVFLRLLFFKWLNQPLHLINFLTG